MTSPAEAGPPPPAPASPEPAAPPPLSAPAAVMLAFLTVAVETEIVEAMILPSSRGRRGVRALHFAFASLQLLGAATLVALGVSAVARLGARLAGARPLLRRLLPVAALFVVALGLSFPALWEDLGGAAEKISPVWSPTILPLLIVAVALSEAVFIGVLAWFGERFPNLFMKRLVAAGIGLGLAGAGSLVLPHDYPGIHLSITLMAGGALAVALNGAALRLPRLPRPALAVGGFALAATLVAPLPNAVVSDMLRATGSVIIPFSSRLYGLSAATAGIPPRSRAWFSPRASLPAVPPRSPRLLPADGVILLITIDALRADVVMSGQHDKRLPNLAALRDQGVRFTRARSPGAQTVPVITGLFTGKYYTQLYWSGGNATHAWAADDDSVRFPELLQGLKVKTVTLPTLGEVASQHGTVRGFDEDRMILRRPPGEPSPLASTVVDRLVARLELAAREGGPLFLFTHLADAHAPYTRGGTDCAPFECYLRELALIDEALGDVRRALAQPAFEKRAVLIVSADHGEAFGEHGQRYHANTLYDELLRVPLLVQSSLFPPHTVDVPVTLLDLGPTILELHGQATPAAFMGESLVRLLRGEPDQLTRPIAADSGRHIQALVFDDDIKVIRDYRRNTVEVYDLARDPGEERNLFDTAPDALQRLGALQAFFGANAVRRPGYAPPYRK